MLQLVEVLVTELSLAWVDGLVQVLARNSANGLVPELVPVWVAGLVQVLARKLFQQSIVVAGWWLVHQAHFRLVAPQERQMSLFPPV